MICARIFLLLVFSVAGPISTYGEVTVNDANGNEKPRDELGLVYVPALDILKARPAPLRHVMTVYRELANCAGFRDAVLGPPSHVDSVYDLMDGDRFLAAAAEVPGNPGRTLLEEIRQSVKDSTVKYYNMNPSMLSGSGVTHAVLMCDGSFLRATVGK